MKKCICLLLGLLLVFCLAACEKPVEEPVGTSDVTHIPTGAPTEGTVDSMDATEPEDPEVPTDRELEEDEWPLEIYAGVYRLDEETDGELHCLEVFDLGNMLVLEHGLYMEGSLYSFWVEEFWPDDQVEWNDLYDPMPGKTQTFSIMTSDTQYDDMAKTCSLRYNDSGIALFYNGGDVVEYYVMDELAVGIHSDTEELHSHLAGQGGPVGEPVGRWYSWNGYTFILAEFDLDGNFLWIYKEMEKPIQVYKGVWTNTDGHILTAVERLGAGRYPYFHQMAWEYNGEKGYLCLREEEPVLLECFGGTDYFYPTDFYRQLPFGQTEALE